ncbi:MAG: hypothetical protein COU66_01010 [Candidatus Pacebacteria bacterium CG10_big_fil_rev_8_21_14_0_10_44_11]|nr:MAG: hypothetical protein COU66_01010 [Candidatus Pacebacteria bacterium CG10_big_fil_rev_8_21_14_0_10_44_11]
MELPEEWNELPKHERKKKFKELRQEQEQRSDLIEKVRNLGLLIVILVVVVFGFIQLTKKSPEQVEFEQQVKAVSLEGKVEEFPIEGRDHVSAGTSVEYQTNPPTSGAHLGEAEDWGVYGKEIDDKAGVHGLEHGGIWISYNEIAEEEKKMLEDIGKSNFQSVIVSPRSANEDKIVVVSWGRMMKLEVADKALIQKYIDTYKNQAPEKLAK